MNENEKNPKHVAIIPDGNRRWAHERGLDPWDGHEVGAQMIEKIAKKARNMGITCISFWGSSVENMTKRPIKERKALLRIYEDYFIKLLNSEDIIKDHVRVNIIGQWKEQLPKSLVNILEDGMEKTRNHEKYTLNFFLAYSGDEEMLRAVQSLVDVCENSAQVTKNMIKKHLMTKDLPPVDYLIRTGGEPHLSAGFMMWDIANAQLYFDEKMFPDFDDVAFEIAIGEYVQRVRRLGA
ncbi:MAG: di-trans,poly-cis-decaprenylcistransferase [Candidatus Moraniibacteriota bacterium]|nr:MAG: di-trans,poly-cis-decaprenylcistransferase [Candidatus Moranbacteria bacterium]